MKKVFTILFAILLSTVIIKAQTPDYFNYQAVVRTNSGELMANQSVGVKISIINGSPTGPIVYTELHKVITSRHGVIDLKIGNGTAELGIFNNIDWTQDNKYINTQIDAGSGYVDLGTTQLLSVPFSFYSKQSDSARVAVSAHNANKLGTDGVYSTNTDTLFVVKDHQGNVVFAVFPDGAQVYVNEQSKGKVGGFAVSGRSPSKNEGNELLFITTDSTRIYTQDTISGFGIRDKSGGTSTSYMQLTPINYFIGHRAGESITTGQYNTFIGYETGLNSTWGDGNMFIGFNAGRSNVDGQLNIFVGNEVGYSFTGADDGEENVFIGNKAGRNITTVANSVFIGTQSGLNCSSLTYSNTFVGDRTGANGNPKSLNTLIGASAGFHSSGENNTYIGAYAGNANYTGNNNVFIGYQAGASETSSNKLHIANNSTTTLIYGDFVNKEVLIDGELTATSVTPSDLNLKTNVAPIQSGLKLLMTLGGYYFNWNDKAKEEFNFSTEEQQLGIIAQDVEKVFPQMVKTNSKGYKVVEYTKLSPVIIEAIKEQQFQIEELKKENEALKEKLNEIIILLGDK